MSMFEIEKLRTNAKKGQPEAQFLLSQICFENKDLKGMIHWLRLASAHGLAAAQEALGHCHEKGRGISQNYNEAMTLYDRAIQSGACLAAYRKAELLHKSRLGPASANTITKLLLEAANANIVPALRTIGYLAMQGNSNPELAVHCMRRAAQAGDPVSCFNLAWFLLRQSGSGESNTEAVYWLDRATASKYPFAAHMLSTLHGVPSSLRPPIGQSKIRLPELFALYPATQAVNRQQFSDDPPVAMFNGVLNLVDCAYLIFLSRPYLRRANVIDPDGRKEGMASIIRTSMSTFLPFGVVDMISRYVELKIIAATGGDLACSEPMSILYYAPGEYYRPHVDFFSPNMKVSRDLLADGGQRTASAVTYLAQPSAGGGTSFPKLRIHVPPKAGSTLWFRNCLDDGQPDSRTLHAGDPVQQGEKWVVTKWFRERPTRYLEF